MTMNERIQELALQAGLKKDHGSDREYVGDLDWRHLAELIVRECAKVCNDVGVALSAEPAQNNFGTAQTCKMAIENHFGVEE
jgi:hypothetical protein